MRYLFILINFFCIKAYTQSFNWAHKFGRDNGKGHTIIQDVKVDDNENFYISGSYTDTLNIDLTQNVNNVIPSKPFLETFFIAKYDKQKNLIWIKKMSGVDIFLHFTFTIDHNNVFIAVSFNDTFKFFDSNIILKSQGKSDFVVLKLDNQGTLLWYKTFGGKLSDYNQSNIEIGKKGHIYVHGIFQDSIFFSKTNGLQQKYYTTDGRKDIFLMKLDSNGERVWFNQIKCYKNNSESKGLAIDNEENVILIGRFEDSLLLSNNKLLQANKYQQFVLKLNDSGKILWVKTIESEIDYFNWLLDVKTDLNNNIYTSFGVTGDYEVVLKNDSIVYKSIRVKQSGILLFKLNAIGNYKWVRTFVSGRKDRRDSKLFISDKVYMIGTYVDSIISDSMNLKLNSKAGNSFLAIVDTNGVILSYFGPKIIGDISGRGGVTKYSLFVKGTSIYTTGYFNVKTDFDHTRNNFILDGSKGYFNKGFVVNYSSNLLNQDSIDNECYTSKIEEKFKLKNLVIHAYPNPIVDFVNIKLNSIPNFVSVRVLNMFGKEIANFEIQKQKEFKLDLTSIPKGLYLFDFNVENSQREYFKLMKE